MTAIKAIAGIPGNGGYKAVYDVGMVADLYDDVTATANAVKLAAARAAQSPDGEFTLAHGDQDVAVPLKGPIIFPCEDFFTKGPVKGGEVPCFGRSILCLAGTRTWPFHTSSVTIGIISSICRIDGENGGAVVRVPNSGELWEGMTLKGRRFTYDPDGFGPDGVNALPAGTRVPYGFEFESYGTPPSGTHLINNCAVWFCGIALYQRAGHYDEDDVFQAGAANGDNVHIENFLAYDVDVVFQNDNEQGVCWFFENLIVGGYGGPGARTTTLFKIVAGDHIVCNGCSANNQAIVVFDVTEYSDQRLICHELRYDGGATPNFLTLFKYSGTNLADMSGIDFNVEVTGTVPEITSFPYPVHKLIQVPQKGPAVNRMAVDNLLFKIARLPKDGFTKVTNDGWWKPGPDYTADLRARYKFNNNLSDNSSYANTGSLSVSNAPTYVAGPFTGSKALSFGHNAGYVNVPDSVSLRIAPGTASIAFWLYLNSYSNGVVLSKFGAATSGGAGFRCESSKLYWTDNDVNKFDMTTWVPIGGWHYIILSITDALAGSMYVDGVYKDVQNIEGLFNNTNPLRIGATAAAFFGSGQVSFDGKIADLRLYAGQLTASEGSDLYAWRPR